MSVGSEHLRSDEEALLPRRPHRQTRPEAGEDWQEARSWVCQARPSQSLTPVVSPIQALNGPEVPPT